ncbi:MAG: hypothetical protein PQJ59_16860 [Spirochaetales bacterium]|nr:hypothetical protein [Spirochaetales bacterium]
MSEKIKRYDIIMGLDQTFEGPIPYYMLEQSYNGYLVKYEEIESELEKVKAERDRAVNDYAKSVDVLRQCRDLLVKIEVSESCIKMAEIIDINFLSLNNEEEEK